MKEETCNGFKNWDTFALAVQISNTYHLYCAIECNVREYHDIDDLKKLVFPWRDEIQASEPDLDFDKVYWHEVLENFQAE